MVKYILIIGLVLILGMMVGYSKGYKIGYSACWQAQEDDLIRNHATVYERWLIGHEQKEQK